MKKFISTLLLACFYVACTFVVVNATETYDSNKPINHKGVLLDEEVTILLNLNNCYSTSGEVIPLKAVTTERNWLNAFNEKQQEILLANAVEEEYIVAYNMIAADENDAHISIKPFKLWIDVPLILGGRQPLLGKDYRLYYFSNDELKEIPIEDSNEYEIQATVDKLGTYVLYYNPGVYSVTFYEDEIIEDENGDIINEEYYKADNLRKHDTFDFPEIPTKEGYVFTGWKHNHAQGSTYQCEYVKPDNYFVDDSWGNWQVQAFDVRDVYASWCPEEEFTPLETTIESVGKITKGKEDGAEIILTLSEGRFYDSFENESYDREYGKIYGEEEEKNYLAYWKSKWSIIGNDDIMIETVEKLDDTTLKFTLSGNSKDKYNTTQIQIGFESTIYSSTEKKAGAYNEYYEAHDIQLDENGIKKAMFVSDNSITLEKQKRSSGGSVEKHTITFETNGGEEIESVRVANGHCLSEPDRVLKEGYVFAGWYTDAELTNAYNFDNRVTAGFTLYAAWEKANVKDYDADYCMIEMPIKIVVKAVELMNSITN